MALAEAGATTVMVARGGRLTEEVARAVTAAGGSAWAQACDVSDYDAVAALVAETRSRFGSVDAPINNAGVIEPNASIAESEPAAWARSIEVNLTGAYHAIRAVLPVMMDAGGGTIVNVSSGARFGPWKGGARIAASLAIPGTSHLSSVTIRSADGSRNATNFGGRTLASVAQRRAVKPAGINVARLRVEPDTILL